MIPDRTIAHHVSIRPELAQPGECCAWMEKAARRCGKPCDGILCPLHRRVAEKRAEKWAETERINRERRRAARQRLLPEWRAELAKITAQLAADQPLEMAAVAGNVHPSIRKRQLRGLSDSHVQKMARLAERAQQLRQQIGDDQ